MSPKNPIKMLSLNHYRLGRMLINNSCSWVSYFDKYRTDKKHRTRELSAFAKLLPKRSRKNEDISKRNCYQAIAKLSAVNKLSTLFCLTPTGSFRKNGKSKTLFMGTKFHEKLIFSAFFSRELATNLRSWATRSVTITLWHPEKVAPPVWFQALVGWLRLTTASTP